MKRAIYVLFLIVLISSIVGCKKDDVKIQGFNVVAERVFKGTTTIILTVEYSYPTVLEEVEGYISENSSMNNAVKVRGEINEKVFKLKFNNLRANTTYYYYWEYSNGVDDLTKTDIKIVKTNDYGLPTVSTNDVTDITAISATCGGFVIDNGGLEITERGVCWSIDQNPTIDGAHTTDGIGIGSYMSSLSNLSPDTKYYICAYATNSRGTNYGEINTFIATDYPGSIVELFSISPTNKVRFSQGNLQYQATTNTWRFAENQYDYIGGSNSNISSSYSGWIDLFGWGTSGYNHGAVLYHPYDYNTSTYSYYAYGSTTYNLNDNTGKADWGYNRISNGGNQENRWRTLTYTEWNYVINTRNTSSGIRYAKAILNGVSGLVLLPDDWNANYFCLNSINQPDSPYNSNVVTNYQWEAFLEANGAVFLPVAGYRMGSIYHDETIVGNYAGRYWSATVYDNSCARELQFGNGYLSAVESRTVRYCGNSVRLVCDAE